MTTERQDDSADARLETALSRYANVAPPVGLERRILARLARKEARRQQSLRVAGVAVIAAVLMAGIIQPFYTLRTAAIGDSRMALSDHKLATASVDPEMPAPTERPVTAVGGEKSPRLTLDESLSVTERAVESIPPSRKSSLVSDLEMDTLGLERLTLSSLTDSP